MKPLSYMPAVLHSGSFITVLLRIVSYMMLAFDFASHYWNPSFPLNSSSLPLIQILTGEVFFHQRLPLH